MINEQELNEKLAKWAGFVKHENEAYPDRVWTEWTHPDGKGWTRELNFTKSLDACVKWLVPKIHAYVLQSFSTAHHLHHASVALPYTNIQNIQVFEANVERTENPALALCLAIEKLIDEANKGGDRSKQ